MRGIETIRKEKKREHELNVLQLTRSICVEKEILRMKRGRRGDCIAEGSSRPLTTTTVKCRTRNSGIGLAIRQLSFSYWRGLTFNDKRFLKLIGSRDVTDPLECTTLAVVLRLDYWRWSKTRMMLLFPNPCRPGKHSDLLYRSSLYMWQQQVPK